MFIFKLFSIEEFVGNKDLSWFLKYIVVYNVYKTVHEQFKECLRTSQQSKYKAAVGLRH